MPSKAVIQCPARPALLTLLFCLTILFATPAAAQERAGAFSGSASPPVSASSFNSTPAQPDLVGTLPPANVGTETAPARDASVSAATEPKPAEPAASRTMPALAPIVPQATTATQNPTSQTALSPYRPEPMVVPDCMKTITAKVVAFDQVYTYNRFGAFNPGGMIYALERDVVSIEPGKPISPGNVQLRPDKRPRPIVLRVNEGDCLQVTFTNLLTPKREDVEHKEFTNQPDKQPVTEFPIRLRQNDTTFTRSASMHVNGLDYVNGPNEDDGANVGRNASSLAGVGETKTYTWYAAKQGQYLLYSMGAPTATRATTARAASVSSARSTSSRPARAGIARR